MTLPPTIWLAGGAVLAVAAIAISHHPRRHAVAAGVAALGVLAWYAVGRTHGQLDRERNDRRWFCASRASKLTSVAERVDWLTELDAVEARVKPPEYHRERPAPLDRVKEKLATRQLDWYGMSIGVCVPSSAREACARTLQEAVEADTPEAFRSKLALVAGALQTGAPCDPPTP